MELVDIYNNRHEKLNYNKEIKNLEPGEYRLSSFIWLINNEKKILIQQRTASTKKMPNMWGATAGAVKKGESSLEGAIRELKEELGLIVEKSELIYLGSNKRINDYIEVWLCEKNIKTKELKLDPKEVQNTKWVSIEKFEKMIKKGTGINSGFEVFNIYYKNFYDYQYEKK